MTRARSTSTDLALIAGFAALVAVCAILPAINISGPVPITLQTFGVLLSGAVLGARRGFLAVLLYLVLGAAGLPIFAGGSSGMATFTGPSGGYLISFPFVYATRPRTAERTAAEGTLREIGAGFRYVARFPWLWLTISLFAFVLMLQWAPIQVLTPKLVREHYDLGVGAYGLVFSAIGAGMILGTVLFGHFNPTRRRGLTSYLIWMLNSVLVIVFALSPWYPAAVVASFLRGICIGFGITVWETMLMQLVPQHMLSRVVSLDWFGSLGLTPFGLLLVGAISGLAPPGEIIAAGAAISMCIIACGLFSKQIRTID